MPETTLAPALSPRALAGAAVGHLGVALPAARVGNAEIAARLGVDPAWIAARTGIRERRAAAPGETLVALAAQAGRAALDAAGADPLELDLVLVATTTPDQLVPAAAPQVAHALGATRAGAIDAGAACTGFVAALALAVAQVEAGRAATLLVIGADVLTRITDPADRRTAALFGDGAGAVLVGRAPGDSRFGPFVLGADGGGAGLLFASRERGVIEMDGHAVFRHAVTRMAAAAAEACARAGLPLVDVDLFVFHQANARILDAVGRRLGLDPARVVEAIALHGNTSAASIPLALDAARHDGRLHDGARVLLAAFGAGFTWGAVVVEWGSGG